MYLCSQCNSAYPDHGFPHRCEVCGGLYDCRTLQYRPPETDAQLLPGIWRYQNTFSLPTNAPVISLGEGNTPLIWTEAFGYPVALKCEYQNPTGSFKDRGTATLTSFLCAHGIKRVVEDSSGNAGASLAAYTARAGISTQIYVPETTSGPKRTQIEAYGAEVIPIPGKRSNATLAAHRAVEMGAIYASHAALPFNLPGYATLAYEIVAQLGEAPGIFICPTGQGGLLLGAARGFNAMKIAGIIDRYPKLIGVQALACDPLARMFQNSSSPAFNSMEGETLAEGVRVNNPLRSKEVIQAVRGSGGEFLTVTESEIISGRDELACRGFYVEMTSAIVWHALEKLVDNRGRQKLSVPVVMVLTGSGLKTA